MNEVFVSFLDFELEIGPGRGREYPVAVTYSPAGEVRATMHFPYDEVALEKRLVVLQNALLTSGGPPRDHPSPEELVVRNLGRDLFDALFTREVRHCYEQSLRLAWGENRRLRLKLRFQRSGLDAAPWEFLYHPSQDEYVCLSHSTPLVRYLESPRSAPPLRLNPPLRVLGMIAGPGGEADEEDQARERERLDAAFRDLQAQGLAELTWLAGGTWRHLQGAMQRGAWHVFHFVGQAGYSRRDAVGDRLGDKGFLALADEAGEIHRLSAANLARLLADHRTLRVALLAGRRGEGGASLRNIFPGTAALLVEQGIPAALSIPYEITDEAATELFRAFYEALALGMPVDAAVAEARKVVSLAVNNSVEWGAAALFMSAPDGLVFDPALGLDVGQEEVIQEPSREPDLVEAAVVAMALEQEPPPAAEPQQPVQAETPAEAEVLEPAPAREAVEPPPKPKRRVPARTPQPIEPGLVLIPAGEFLMGSDPGRDPRAYEAEQPQHAIYLPDYHIAKTPITNAQYAAFVEASSYQAPRRWVDGKPPAGKEDFPVAYISWYDASAYCKWLSEKNGQPYRLPSEAEWEKAARGSDGRIYPWGDVWETGRCNSKEGGPDDATLVDAYPDGASPYGILDVAGNVWEWTGSLYRPYPYDAEDGREGPRVVGKRVLRGGAFYSGARRVRCAYRDSGYPENWRGSYGFRIVLAPS